MISLGVGSESENSIKTCKKEVLCPVSWSWGGFDSSVGDSFRVLIRHGSWGFQFVDHGGRATACHNTAMLKTTYEANYNISALPYLFSTSKIMLLAKIKC